MRNAFLFITILLTILLIGCDTDSYVTKPDDSQSIVQGFGGFAPAAPAAQPAGNEAEPAAADNQAAQPAGNQPAGNQNTQPTSTRDWRTLEEIKAASMGHQLPARGWWTLEEIKARVANNATTAGNQNTQAPAPTAAANNATTAENQNTQAPAPTAAANNATTAGNQNTQAAGKQNTQVSNQMGNFKPSSNLGGFPALARLIRDTLSGNKNYESKTLIFRFVVESNDSSELRIVTDDPDVEFIVSNAFKKFRAGTVKAELITINHQRNNGDGTFTILGEVE